QVSVTENGLFVDSAPEDEKKKIIDDNPEVLDDWDPVTGDRVTRLCFIGRQMDKDAIVAGLDKCVTEWIPD
ncbi:MAG: GTP-binding protein, partial [Olsenella sp.]